MSKFFLCVTAPINEEKGITIRLIPNEESKLRPETFRRGIRTDPPPIPNMPLIKPEKIPIPRRAVLCRVTNSIYRVLSAYLANNPSRKSALFAYKIFSLWSAAN